MIKKLLKTLIQPKVSTYIDAKTRIKKNDPVVTIESDKSSVEIPSTIEGKIEKIEVKVGDKVSKNDLLLTISDKNNLASDSQEVPKNTENLIKEAEKYLKPEETEDKSIEKQIKENQNNKDIKIKENKTEKIQVINHLLKPYLQFLH